MARPQAPTESISLAEEGAVHSVTAPMCSEKDPLNRHHRHHHCAQHSGKQDPHPQPFVVPNIGGAEGHDPRCHGTDDPKPGITGRGEETR